MTPSSSDSAELRAIATVRRLAVEGWLPDSARWLGMREEQCAPLLRTLGLDADDSGIESVGLLLSPAPYLPMLNSMLWTYRADDGDITRLTLAAVASACFGSRHLWEDLGLNGREDVSALLQRHCPGLAASNAEGVRWKRYLFQRLGEELGLRGELRPPGCTAREDAAVSFGATEITPAMAPAKKTTKASKTADAEAIQLRGAVWMTTVAGENLGGHGRVGLLRAIAEQGSITQAAKAFGMSYKAAWDAVDTMNTLAGEPLVERSTGGKGGGSTRLTARGVQLVERFGRIETLHQRFVQLLSDEAIDLGTDFNLLRMLNMKTSARNQFLGTVTQVKSGAVNDEVELELAGGTRIVAVVTHESTQSLGLKPGAAAFALVKASSIVVGTDLAGAKLSSRNQLAGTVTAVNPGAVNTEIVIALPGGAASIAAIVTQASAQSLGLAVGQPATALFKASSVILGAMA